MKNFLGIVTILFTVIFHSVNLYGADFFGEPNVTFERITRKDGLSNSTVNYIIQDRNGFMWFATYDGINRYDGYSFKVYRHNEADISSLSHDGIVFLCEDGDGYIWVVNNAHTGLDKFDPETEKFTLYVNDPEDPTSLSSNDVQGVFKDRSGNTWICTANALNLVVNEKTAKKTVTRFKRFYNKSSSAAFNMGYENRNGQLLLFADYLYNFNRKNNEIIKTDVALTQSSVRSVSEDREGNLWLGTSHDGIVKLIYDARTDDYKRSDSGIPDLNLINRNYMVIDHKDRIWIGNESSGLYQYDKNENQLRHFENDESDANSISDNTIYCLYIDGSGVLWIGTFSQGLCKYDLYKKPFYHFKSIPGNENSLSGNVISSIHSTRPGELWVGLDLGGGINRLIDTDINKPKVFRYKIDPDNTTNSAERNSVLCLLQRRNGDIWSGSAGGIIAIMTPEEPGANNQPSQRILRPYSWPFCMYEDRDEIIWVGTWSGGLYRYNNANFVVNFTNDPQNPKSLCDNIVWAITEDDDGNIWIGGHGGGLSILPAKEKNKPSPEFINFEHIQGDTSSLSNNTINTFCQDNEGTMWIGTSAGLNKVILNKNNFRDINANTILKFVSYHVNNGFPSEGIIGIVEDNSGNLWISTSNGLSKFDSKKETCINYDVTDGLQGNEFWHNAYFKDQEGRLFFGGQNGFNAFYADSIKPNPFIPRIVFTEIKLFNKPVGIGDKINNDVILTKSIYETSKIILSHKNNILSIEFATLHYTEPLKNKYAYKLEGFDKDWVETGSDRRFATYTNLPAGSYTFKVRASNNDGLWNEEGASLEVIILPPWWRTLLFRIIATIIIIGSIIAFYYYRLNRLNRQKRLLQELVRKRTKEIEEKNAILLQQTDELNETNTLLEERQQRIEEQSEELKTQAEELSNTNKILVTLNATKDKFFSIIAHDLKNPFSSILGFCEILTLRYDKYNDEKRKHLIGVIDRSAQNVFKLLENLLQWSRSQTGNIKYSPEEFNISDIVRNIHTLNENALTEKGIKFSYNIPEELNMYADKNMIYTVIRNLVTNAIKFTEMGEIQVEAAENESYVKVSIRDTGVGIRSEVVDKIFEIEKSKSTEGTRGEPGTGLGLIICRDFVEKNGGTIGVESEVGKGSVFYFTIPKVQE